MQPDRFFARQHTALMNTLWLQMLPRRYFEKDLRSAGAIIDLAERRGAIRSFHGVYGNRRKAQFVPAVFARRHKLQEAMSGGFGPHRLRELACLMP